MDEFKLSLGRKGKAGEFDSADLKAGLRKSDFKSEIAKNIFDALDKSKDGTLDGIEVEKFLAQLKDIAKNDNLSKREAKKLLKLEGSKGIKGEQLFEFLKEIKELETDNYSAFADGSMGVEITGGHEDDDYDDVEPEQLAEQPEQNVPEEEEPEIDNSKAYYNNGRVMTVSEDGKSILVQENENSEPVKLSVDEEGNIISHAKNGESFNMTAKRLGLPTEGELYEKFKELNEKAAKKGYFLVGGKVKIPADAVENLAFDKVNVNSENEITAYNKFMAKKREEVEKQQQQQQPQDSKDLSDEEFREKYPYIARPDENTPSYEPPTWEVPKPFEPKVSGADEVSGNRDDKHSHTGPTEQKPPASEQSQGNANTEKTELNNPKKLAVTKEDFTIENLRKRYPADKYEEVDGNPRMFVDKSTGKPVFSLSDENKRFKPIAIIYKDGKKHTSMMIKENGFYRTQYDDNEKVISNAVYDKDGRILKEEQMDEIGEQVKLVSYDSSGNRIATYDAKSKTYDCPIAKELQELIYAKNTVGLPVSKDKEIKETVLNKLTPENIETIMKAYKSTTGVDLLKDIGDEWAISSSDMREIKNHIKKCLNEFYDYKPDMPLRDSKVKNDIYTGGDYTVVQKDDVITVKNKSTGKEHTIDLESVLAEVEYPEKIELKKIIQNLPGEVLEDFSIEVDDMKTAESLKGVVGAGAYYSGRTFNGTDDVTMIQFSANNMIHELGHAVDYHGYVLNSSSISENENFIKVNSKEMEAYLAAGNKRYNYDDNSTHYTMSEEKYTYCTTNDKEMFAECYTLLMYGDCYSKDVILKYFPETLKAVQEHLMEIRKLPESKRH